MPESIEPSHLLAFETAGPALSVALCRGGRTLAALHRPLARGHAELLLPAVAAVLRAGDCARQEVAAIATTVGPGSFTGLRTGLAAAQGLGLALQRPLVGLDRYSVLAAASELRGRRVLVVAFDSKARSLYAQMFATNGAVAEGWPSEGRNLSAEEAAALVPDNAVLLGDGVPALVAAGARGEDSGWRAVTAVAVARAAAAELARGSAGWPPQPLYLAPPRATLPKNGGRLRARPDTEWAAT